VQWAINVAYCESRYHPNSVNSSSGASGLFQFLPSTWSGTPYANQSPFDPRANSFAAAWLYSHYGPGRWECQG
jgi:soluble lytic murein transglycosylase-like protein